MNVWSYLREIPLGWALGWSLAHFISTLLGVYPFKSMRPLNKVAYNHVTCHYLQGKLCLFTHSLHSLYSNQGNQVEHPIDSPTKLILKQLWNQTINQPILKHVNIIHVIVNHSLSFNGLQSVSI